MRNLTMLMDYYELTMSNGYFEKGFKDKMVVFDMFYRKNPDNGGFVVSAGLEQLIEYIENCAALLTVIICIHGIILFVIHLARRK